MVIFVAIGIICIVIAMFSEQTEYKVLKQEPLLFDYPYLTELTMEYRLRKKKYIAVAIPCTVLFLLGIVIFACTVRGYILWSQYHSFVFLGLAIGLLGFAYSIGVIEAYELIINNEQYTTSFSFKIKRKLKDKFDQL